MSFPQTLPKFLKNSFAKYECDDGKSLYLKDLSEIATNLDKSLMVSKDGNIIQVNKGTLFWENIKGAFGGVNHTKKALVEYRFIRLLEYGMAKKWISSDVVLNNIHKIATSHFGLNIDKVRSIHKHKELSELIYIISTKFFEQTGYSNHKSISDRYVKQHQFDLEPHSIIVRLWHAFRQSLISERPAIHELEIQGPHDFSKFGAGQQETREEGEEEEEEIILTTRQPEGVARPEGNEREAPVTIGMQREDWEPAPVSSPQAEVQTEKKKTLEEEKADTEAYVKKEGFSKMKYALTGGLLLLGGATAAAVITATAPVTVPAAASAASAPFITPTVAFAAIGATTVVTLVAKKALGYLRGGKKSPTEATLQDRVSTFDHASKKAEGGIPSLRPEEKEMESDQAVEEEETFKLDEGENSGGQGELPEGSFNPTSEDKEELSEDEQSQFLRGTTSYVSFSGEEPSSNKAQSDLTFVVEETSATAQTQEVRQKEIETNLEELGMSSPEKRETPELEGNAEPAIIPEEILSQTPSEGKKELLEGEMILPLEDKEKLPDVDEPQITEKTVSPIPSSDEEHLSSTPSSPEEDQLSVVSEESTASLADDEGRQIGAEERAARKAQRKQERREIAGILSGFEVAASSKYDKALSKPNAERILGQMRTIKQYLEKGGRLGSRAVRKLDNFQLYYTLLLKQFYSGDPAVLGEIETILKAFNKLIKEQGKK